MHFQTKFRAGPAAAQSFCEPASCFIESRNRRPGAACRGVKFLKHSQSALAKMSHHLLQTGRGISLVHQHEPADDRVKHPVELHRGRIAEFKGNVTEITSIGSAPGPFHCGRRAIYSNHVSVRTNQLGGQEADVSAAAADIKYAHAPCYARFGK